MKRVLVILALLAGLCVGLQAQAYTSVTGSNLTDLNGNKLVSGQICFLGTDQADQPVSFGLSGGGQVLRRPSCFTVTNGVIAAGAQIPNPATTSPSGILYRITVTDTQTKQVVLVYNRVSLQGSSWDFDTYQPYGIPVPPPRSPASVTGPLNVSGDVNVTGTTSLGAVAGSPVFTTTVGAKNFEQFLFADQFPGADCGAKVMAADADLGSSSGIIVVTPACGTFSTQIVFANANRVLYFAPGGYTFSYAGTDPDAYTVSGPIHITASNVSVLGSSRTTTILNFTASPQSVGIDTLPAGCVVADGCASQQSGIEVSGLTLNGNQSSASWPATDTNGDGISLQAGCMNCFVHDNSIHDWTYQGIVVTGAQATSVGAVVARNLVYNVGEYGIGLESYTRNSIVSANVVGPLITTKVAGGATGIYTASLAAANGSNQNNDNNSITGNTVYSAPEAGIVIQAGSRWPKVVGNTIVSPGSQCISVGTTAGDPAPLGVLISGNHCYHPGITAGGGIQAQGLDASHLLSGLAVTGNYVESAQGAGILIGPYVSAPSVSGNDVNGAGKGAGASKTDGIFLSVVSAPELSSNVVTGAAGYGVNIAIGTTDAIVSANNLTGNTGGAYTDAGTRTLLWGNKENTTDTTFHITGVLASQLQLANNVAISGDNGSGTQCRLVGYLGSFPQVGDVDGCSTDAYFDAASGATFHLHFGTSGDLFTATGTTLSLLPGKIFDLTSGALKEPSAYTANGVTINNPSAGGTLVLTSQLPLYATLSAWAPGALAAGACDTTTQTVTGAATTATAAVSPAADPGTGLTWDAWVSAAGTVSVRLCNTTAASITPNGESYNIRVIQ